jgi:hypothetical protein
MANLGNDAECSGTGGIDSGTAVPARWGMRCTAGQNGTVEKIYVDLIMSAPRNINAYSKIKCAIYAWDSGGNHTLLEETNELTMTQPAHFPVQNGDFASGWHYCTFNNPVSITNGNQYLLCVTGELYNCTLVTEILDLDADSNGGTDFDLEVDTSEAYANAWADPWNPPSDAANWRAGIYCPFLGTNMQINIGDSWKELEGLQINIGDVWKPVASAQINIGDAWKTIF